MAGNKKQMRIARQRKQIQRMRRLVAARLRSMEPIGFGNRSLARWLANLLAKG